MLHEARVKKKMTARKVEELANIGGRMFTAYENGKIGGKIVYPERMSLTAAARLAKTLGIDLNRLAEAALEDEKENGKARK